MKKIEKLKPFQETAIENTVTVFQSADRAKVIMPCGTGKTIVGIKIREQLKPNRTLIVAPSLALVKQLLDSYVAENSLQSALVVCSDNTTANEARNQFDIPRVTTNPKEIEKELRKRDGVVVFSTYQSTPKIAECFQGKGVPRFDLGIFDESHHMATASKIFTTPLEDSAIPIRKRLFMTATPRVAMDRDKKRAEIDGYLIACMDDESQFGKESFRMSFGEAIRDGHLTDYQVAIFAVKESDIRSMIANDEDVAGMAKRVALVQAMRQYDLRKVLVYHRSVKPMNWFAETGIRQTYEQVKLSRGDTAGLWSEAIDGKDNAKKRKEILDTFREINGNRRAILSSCRTLQEGVDCPSVDAICILDPRKQPIDIVQIIGRAIRNSPDKKIATIVLPVFMPDDIETNTEAFLGSAEFAAVHDVLIALKSHDERIQGLVAKCGGSKKPTSGSCVVFGGAMVSSSLQLKMIDAIKSRITRIEKAYSLLTEELVIQWMKEYYAKNKRWPAGNSKDLSPCGSTWIAINLALKNCYRGITKQSSLSILRKCITGSPVLLTEELIIQWMKDYYKQHGTWPASRTKELTPCGRTWKSVDIALAGGHCGLTAGMSIGKLLNKIIGKIEMLTDDVVIQWMELHYKRYGTWPHKDSKERTPDDSTWNSIDVAARQNRRGLFGLMSLAKIREKHLATLKAGWHK